MWRLRCAMLSCVAFTVPACAFAQSPGWPVKPLRFLISFAPGGFTDTLARTMADRLANTLGQPVLAENRPGAGGVLAAEATAKSLPDGYTLLMVSSGLAINATLQTKLPYDTVRDLQPVALIAELPNLLIVHPSLPVKTVKDLIALAKQQPGKLSYASAGVGSSQHLSGELFKSMTGVDIAHVPYKGGAPATIDLLGGHVHLTFGSTSPLASVRAGRLRLIAVTSAKRNTALPDAPTIGESIPGYEASVWYAVMTTAGTPRDIVQRVANEIRKVTDDPTERAKFVEQTAELRWMGPDELGTFIRGEIKRWGEVVKRSGARVD
ncbi:MAG: tripartite tricarboxylate transporter substrate binding protein [Proteobacteria bacterium]|nr:tripartite tricarboxylate transporter substrate binding protein [Burkholderiales bacterium]